MRRLFNFILLIAGITLVSVSLGFCENGALKLNQDAEKRSMHISMAVIDSSEYVKQYPELQSHLVAGVPFHYIWILKESELQNIRTKEYNRKRNTELIIGGTIMAASLAGFVYTFEVLPTPVHHTPWTEEYSEDKYNQDKRNRWIAFGISSGVGAVGTFIFARAFRWNSRIQGEASLNYFRLHFLLNRQQQPYDGVKTDVIRTFGHYPRYRQ